MLPANPISGTEYQGKNQVILMAIQEELGYTQPHWVTYRQAQDNGGQVRKGEKGVRCVKMLNFEDEKTKRKFKRPTGFTVFNVSQVDWDGEPSTTPPIKPIIPKSEPKRVDLSGKLRGLADKMQASIDSKFADRLENTPKRVAQGASSRMDGNKLQRTQTALYALADMHEAGEVPEVLQQIKSKKDVLECMSSKSNPISNGYHSYYVETGEPRNDDELTLALWALLKPKSAEDTAKEELQRKVTDLQFCKIPGYFPTPKAVIDLMLEHADLFAGMSVLEPSAGSGAIMDALEGLGCNVRGVEINHTLAHICKDKGHICDNESFLDSEYFNGLHDRVIMNPPFENLQHVDHIRHAFEMLDDMGRLVAVLPPLNSTKKCVEFQEWVDSLGGEFVALPGNSFKESGTGVNTQLLILDK